jgi:2'-5' RNA ligase
MPRLFVAFELPMEVRALLSEALPSIAGGRPVKVQLMHVTLRFAGELEMDTAQQLESMLEAASAQLHDLGFTKAGTFPALGSGRAPTVLFMGLERAPELLKLQSEIDDAVEACGQPREARAFHPHVTVARLKNAPTSQVQRAVAAFEELPLPRFTVRDFVLFESTLAESGSSYRELRRYALSPAPGR